MQASSAPTTSDAPKAKDPAEALVDDLFALNNRLMAATHRDLFAAMEKSGLNITLVKCLGVLNEADGPVSLGHVSDTLGLSLAAISRSVDALVRRGQVKREEDPDDRRSKLVSVTARGRATYGRLHALRRAGVRAFVDRLEPDERESLAAAVGPVVRRLA